MTRNILPLTAALVLSFYTTAHSQPYPAVATWYGKAFHDRQMANGEKFNRFDSGIVAHKTLKMGTCLSITNPKNSHTIEVVVKDRGPYEPGRDFDLSEAGAELLGIKDIGVATVVVETLKECP